jgi:hypothetical protein
MMTRPQKRVSLFADSLALPRGRDWGNVAFEETYPYLLERELRKDSSFRDFIFINRAQRFRTIVNTLEEISDFAILPSSDWIVIHCGIVDCAPRIFTASQREWLGRIPSLPRRVIVKLSGLLRRLIIKYVTEGKCYVPLEDFKKSLDALLTSLDQSLGGQVVLVNIIVPSIDLEEKSPGFQKNARLYNHEIKAAADKHGASFIDLDGFVHANGGHSALTVDGMHVNAEGHKFLTGQLLELMKSK